MGRNNKREKNQSFGGFLNRKYGFSLPAEDGDNERPAREMHKAKCSECGADCTVPFKPTGDKPVFCRDCFRKKKKF